MLDPLDDGLITQASALRAQVNALKNQLSEVEARLQKSALERIEQIRAEMKTLLDEAEQLSRDAGVTFYRETFVQGIDRDGNSGYYGDPYWEQSAYC